MNKLEIFNFYSGMIKSLMEVHLDEDEQNKVLDIMDCLFHTLMKKVNDDGKIK